MAIVTQYNFDKNYFPNPNPDSSIGKWSGRSIFSQKAMLSYTQAGWKLVHLNLIQLFLRKVFGAYQTTHLDYILKDRTAEKANSSYHNHVWAKRHVTSLGNAQLDKAQVICFGESHSDTKFHAYEISVIKRLYQPGDVILFEGVEVETQISNWHFSSLDRLKPFAGYEVYGWEPKVGSRVVIPDVLEEPYLKKLEKAMGAYDGDVLQTDQLKVVIEQVNSWICEIEKTCNFTQETITDLKLGVSKDLLRFQKGEIKEKKEIMIFWATLLMLYKNSEKGIKQCYAAIPQSSRLQIMNQMEGRNRSLAEQIQEFRHSRRRVFVIAGFLHLVDDLQKDKKKHQQGIEQVQQVLKQSSFITFFNKDLLRKR